MGDLLEVDPQATPKLLCTLHNEFKNSYKKKSPPPHSNFLSGVKWSPDGVCFLTAADDNCLRIYDLPPSLAASTTTNEENQDNVNPNQQAHQLDDEDDEQHDQDPFSPAVRIPAGELIYDYNWYPWASATDPATCCFVITTRAHPIHLYDAVSGQLRCSYRPFNEKDELDQAHGICFSPDGSKIFAGGRDSTIYIFDVNRPGRDHDTLSAAPRKKDRKRNFSTSENSDTGQPGIISCIACPKDTSGLMAAGSYSGITALYDFRTPAQQLALLEGHKKAGITHLKFSPCGTYLYSGARSESLIYCWDARSMSGPVYTLERNTKGTNQRIYFDIEPCGRHLASGGLDGTVTFWDLRDGKEAGKFRVVQGEDVVNGCEFHPSLPILATATGQRRLEYDRQAKEEEESSSDDDEEVGRDKGESDAGEESMQVSGGGENVKYIKGRQGYVLKRGENSLRLWRLGMRTVLEADAAAAAVVGAEGDVTVV